MGNGKLDVQEDSYHVAAHHEDKSRLVRWDMVHETVAVPEPEYDVADNFKIAMPPCYSLSGSFAKKEEEPRLEVEVEASKGEDGVVHILLPWNQEPCCSIVFHKTFVEC